MKAGTLPTPQNPSLVSNTIPGSTQTNSRKQLASFKDLGSLMDSLKLFTVLYNETEKISSKSPDYNKMNKEVAEHLKITQQQIDTNVITDEYADIIKIKSSYDNANKKMRQYPKATTDSKKNLASFKDLGSLLDSLKTFSGLYLDNEKTASMSPDFNKMNKDIEEHLKIIQSQFKTGIIKDEVDQIKQIQSSYDSANKKLGNSVPSSSPSPLTQPSTQPSTQPPPSSTTANKKQMATFKDLGSLIDSLKTFSALYYENKKIASKSPDYNKMNKEVSEHLKITQEQINNGVIEDKLSDIKKIQNSYETAIIGLKELPKPVAKTTLSDGDTITVKDIEKVVERGDNEYKKLTSLRSEDPVTKKRIATILRILADLNGILDKIKRGKMKIADVPFKKKDLLNVFKSMDKNQEIKPNLIKSSKASTKLGISSLPMTGLAKLAKDLYWDVHIGYDPEVTLKRKAMEKIDSVTTEIKNGTIKGKDIKKKMLDLQILKQQYVTDNRRSITSSNKKDLEPYDNNLYASAEEGYQPTPVEFTNGAKIKQPLSFDDNENNDWKIRPGYKITDDTIKTRGSAASFDTSAVGGPDYFKRAQFLCNQIADAGLGKPSEFGCIDGKSEVSKEYSWKGNYLMVCSRLGNIWGGWYPEMFGCPNTEESTFQIPNKKFNP